jgi:hypothetical protein
VDLSLRARPQPRAAARSSKDPAMLGPNPNTKLRNWLVLIVLAALAAFMYLAVVVKIANHAL